MDSTGGGLGGGIGSVIEDGNINANQDTSKKIEHTQNSHAFSCAHMYMYTYMYKYLHIHISTPCISRMYYAISRLGYVIL